MKLTTILLLSICLHVSAGGFSQKVTLHLKSASPEKVFSEIQKSIGYSFIYSKEDLQLLGVRDVDIEDVQLTEFLKGYISTLPLSFVITDKFVVIKKEERTTIPASADFLPITGIVKGEDGTVLVGATVRVKGKPESTSTDENGKFLILADVGDILVVSYVGFQNLEFKLSRSTDISLVLIKSNYTMDTTEIVVNTGYQRISKERSVGAFSQLDSASYARRTGMGIIDRLDGTVTGVLFDKKSGGLDPIQIRGISTINNNKSPLIILDDFPFTGDLSSINPNDIESITVLKDAAAASIWGSRAGNGVIVITSKRGRFNQPFSISASSNITVQAKPDLYYFPQMSSSDFIDVERFLFDKGFYDGRLSNTTLRPVISPVVELLDKVRNGKMIQADADAQINSLRYVDLRNDINKYVNQRALTQQHYINMSGGNGMMNYAFSGGYNRTLPNTRGTRPSEQYTITGTNRFKPVSNLEFETGINYSRSNNNNPASILNNSIYPYAQLADKEGSSLAVPNNYRISYLDTAGGGKLLDWQYRPLDELKLADNNLINQFVKINLGVSYKATRWLSAEIKYQYINQTNNNRDYKSEQTFYSRNLINQFTNLNPSGSLVRNPVPLGGILDETNSFTRGHAIRGQLNFNQSWNGVHAITALVAGEVNENNTGGGSVRVYGYNADNGNYQKNIDYINAYPIYAGITGSSVGIIPNNNTVTPSTNIRLVSLLANLSYVYLNRYSFYASARRDGANLFGVNINNRWKPLWSVGINWDIKKEHFIKSDWLSSLRLRSSYGFTGNAGSGSGLPTIVYFPVGNNPGALTNLQTAEVGNAPNPELRWEQVRILNTGIDFGILKDRITGSFDVYNKKASDLIAPVPFDPTSGVNIFIVNSASLKGNGFDLTLVSKNIRGVFEWQTSFGLSHSKMMVTQLFKGGFRASDFIKYGLNAGVGKIAYGLSSYKWGGLDPLTGDPRGFINGHVSKDYNSISNDSIDNQIFNGSSIPLYNGYVMNSFIWKGFTLSATLTYRLAYYFRRSTINYSSLFNNQVSHSDYTLRWQQPGDEKNTTVPAMIYPVSSSLTLRDEFYAQSEVNVLRADNVKLQDIRLQYDLRKSRLKVLSIRGLQIFIYANNLNMILWRKNKSDLDPDVSGGNSRMLIPTPKSFTGGFSINL